MTQNLNEKVALITGFADDKLGLDIKEIAIGAEVGICDRFIVITGRNKNHTQAIADEIEEKMLKEGYKPESVEGFREGNWILMDYGDIIVHVFTADQRQYYGLERLWQNNEA